ncbi:MAG: phosphoribosylformylglycinamidine synthase [Bacteroidales bacterium]|jgi:phosphoribosylformylglycinamidine synthase|nr:phosphoribosylformylglycinamidine synthase [Bacteroidales bacterium]
MTLFFKGSENIYFALITQKEFDTPTIEKLIWLFGDAKIVPEDTLKGDYIGPRKEMISPWSTNAVEITQNMGIEGISRIELLTKCEQDASFDPMLQMCYHNPGQDIFTIDKEPEAIVYIDDIVAYNQQEGLALSDDEIAYLNSISKKIHRKLTDSEVYGFAQVNSEHCRHKIFNGTFVIDGEEKKDTLFALIKNTSNKNPNYIVSAYKDNVAFILGPDMELFAPASQDTADLFRISETQSVISLKAETHNFPTTVEPFNGASTGTGGEIRDRLAGGKGSTPIAGTAVYMTSYSRNGEAPRAWEQFTKERSWLYHTPEDILIKASNGASDFGNKFGQPLICGSLLTFEHTENDKHFGYDKVIMLAGGVGFAKHDDSEKDTPEPGDMIIVLGGDNYRIGMGGGAVSSVATGEYNNAIELNAVQRANPEMQKRVANTIRAFTEMANNPIISIHDHGAGGHLNCLSELVEATGGHINVDKLPVGDSTLSAREIIGNESQERMGLVLRKKNIPLMERIAARERTPMYVVGEITDDCKLIFEKEDGEKPIDLALNDFFGKVPKTVLQDNRVTTNYKAPKYDVNKIDSYIESVLQLESVACKDWLTNKVDRSVSGKVAKQQCAGPLQLPLNNLGAVAIDYRGTAGIATSIGHAPVVAIANPEAGSRLAVAESLTNLVWAPLRHGIKGVSLSANWMWPAKTKGENDRLYRAVGAVAQCAIDLNINIPTGKDSLSMTQKYPDGQIVYSQGTVIISAIAEISDIKNIIESVVKPVENSKLIFIDFSNGKRTLGGSALAQVVGAIGNETPDMADGKTFIKKFNAIQDLINRKNILAGHDIASGGLITTLLEMNFAQNGWGMSLDLTEITANDDVELLFSENPGVVIQVKDNKAVFSCLEENGIDFKIIGEPIKGNVLALKTSRKTHHFDIPSLRDLWFKTSYLFDKKQSGETLALQRFENYKKHEHSVQFPVKFNGLYADYGIVRGRRVETGIRAAIIREKGVNGDREMAWSLHLSGFDVKDVHVTDLISGRENLKDVNMVVFVGGFSNSDVLGSAKGWAGALKYNPLAKQAIDNFYKRKDTLSLGVCNGCQLMTELDLVYPEFEKKPKMLHNASHKFESNFLTVNILENNSVMLKSLIGSRLGIWIAHGEGKFYLPEEESKYAIPMKYSFETYPANPNGSDYNAAAICSLDGRHLAMMPHLERSVYPWQWGFYPSDNGNAGHQVTPWIEAFVNARKWIDEQLNRNDQ